MSHNPKAYTKKFTIYILLAMILGVITGFLFPKFGADLKILPDIFIKLIKTMIAPIIFLTIVSGIAGMKDLKKLGSIGAKALLYFEVLSTFSLLLGIFVALIVKPGVGFDIKMAEGIDISRYVRANQNHTASDFFFDLVPDSFVGAFAKGDILSILLLSILFGLALVKLGKNSKGILKSSERLLKVFFVMVNMIMFVSPIAVFGAFSYTIGKFGIKSLIPLGKLVLCGYLTVTVFVVVILGGIAYLFNFSLIKLLKYIKEEIILVFGTCSSETAMPTLIEKLEKLGCSEAVVGLVVPTGYSFNLDGSYIYLGMSIFFIAQAYGVDLSWIQYLSILGILMLTSKGATAVPGSGFITMAATLASIPGQPIPVAGIAMLLGIDRFMSEARSVTNLIGNSVATIIISKWEKDFSEKEILILEKRKRIIHEKTMDPILSSEKESQQIIV